MCMHVDRHTGSLITYKCDRTFAAHAHASQSGRKASSFFSVRGCAVDAVKRVVRMRCANTANFPVNGGCISAAAAADARALEVINITSTLIVGIHLIRAAAAAIAGGGCGGGDETAEFRGGASVLLCCNRFAAGRRSGDGNSR